MNLREAKADDLDGVLLLYKELIPSDLPLEEKLAEDIFHKICSDSSFFILVLESDECLVSSCALSVIPNLTRGGKPYAVIENVITNANYRKNGFGKQIMKYAISFAKEKGCYKIMLQSGSANPNTQQFYKKLGFSNTSKTAYVIKDSVPMAGH